jgi:hypothetical protein
MLKQIGVEKSTALAPACPMDYLFLIRLTPLHAFQVKVQLSLRLIKHST